MKRALWLALLGGALQLPVAAAGELLRMEAVGAVGASKSARTPDLRERATRAAVARATKRVAFPLLDPEALARQPIAPGEIEDWLNDLLGEDPLEYAARFRVLEDRGIRPSLFGTQLENEYVVVVETHVDVGQLRERLASQGVLRVASANEPRRRVQVVAELNSFEAYRALQEALSALPSVEASYPVLFERGRAELAIDTHSPPDVLLLGLMRESPPHLQVDPLGVGEERLRLRVEWREHLDPPVPASPGGAPEDAGAGADAGFGTD